MMPLLIRNHTRCVISGRLLRKGDNIVAFPAFPCEPNEPEFRCYDGVALRDEFEKWELRDRVVRRVGESWVSWYHASKAFTILSEDQDYLLVQSRVEKRVQLLFLRHILLVDIYQEAWREFYRRLTSKGTSHVRLYSDVTLSWEKTGSKVKICLRNKDGGDCIELTLDEWAHLRHVLLAKKDLFDR